MNITPIAGTPGPELIGKIVKIQYIPFFTKVKPGGTTDENLFTDRMKIRVGIVEEIYVDLARPETSYVRFRGNQGLQDTYALSSDRSRVKLYLHTDEDTKSSVSEKEATFDQPIMLRPSQLQEYDRVTFGGAVSHAIKAVSYSRDADIDETTWIIELHNDVRDVHRAGGPELLTLRVSSRTELAVIRPGRTV